MGTSSTIATCTATGTHDPPSPTMSVGRESLRCYRCLLVQFPTTDRRCRRCHQSVDPPPIPDPVPGTDIPTRPYTHPIDPATLLNLELTLPLVLYWLRLRKGMNLNQMAASAGTIRQVVYRLEAGKTIPRLEMIGKIAGGLGVDVSVLMRYCEFLQFGR